MKKVYKIFIILLRVSKHKGINDMNNKELTEVRIVQKALTENGYNMDKIEISYNSVGAIQIKDYSHKQFINGLAVLDIINYYEGYIKIDVIKPNHLIHETIKLDY